MYIILVYDISLENGGAKIWRDTYKICKKYLSHFQKSVFRGDITPSKLISLRSELKSIIVENEDFVCILKSISPNVFGEETLGNPTPNGENIFL